MDYAYQAYTAYAKRHTLKADMDMDAVRLEISKFWNGVLLHVTEATGNTQIRNVYSLLVQQAKNHTDTLSWLDKPEVFYSTAAANKGKRRIPWFGLCAAVLLIAMIAWFAVPHKEQKMLYAYLLGAALLLFAIQLIVLLAAISASPTINIRTEQRFVPEKVYSGLMKMAKEIDGSADTLVAMAAENVPAADDVDLSLAQELIRLPKDLSTDEVRTAVDRFLVRNKIEKILYSAGQQELFMVLPADREMTIEPALVKDGKILSMGVACTPGEG